jgi:DNA-binding beta-propeller fold protein YncE
VRPLSVFAALACLITAFGQSEARRPTPRTGDHLPATQAEINDPLAIAVDGSQTLYIAEITAFIRRVDLKSGIITTVKTKARLTAINSVAVDTNGNLIATEFTEDRVRRIDPPSGSVTTIAGGRRREFSGDGGPAINAGLNQPSFVTIDTAHNIYIADTGNGRSVAWTPRPGSLQRSPAVERGIRAATAVQRSKPDWNTQIASRWTLTAISLLLNMETGGTVIGFVASMPKPASSRRWPALRKRV